MDVWRAGSGDGVVVVGVLNTTPDSFSDGGLFSSPGAALERARALRDEGADAIDVGGESTRPGAPAVSVAEELARVLPVIEAIAKSLDVPVSVDTRRAEVASRAIGCGASCVNAVAGLRDDPELAAVCAETGAALILNHMRGTPATMQERPRYDDVLEDVRAELLEQVERAERAGVARDALWIDPGLGFGKHPLRHNLPLLAGLPRLVATGLPVLVGASRKSFIGRLTGAAVDERLPGSLAALSAAVLAGARGVRVHDVAASRQAADVARAIRNAGRSTRAGTAS